ncbi:chitinase-3-like protein 2 [Haemaphysalis longicornis]
MDDVSVSFQRGRIRGGGVNERSHDGGGAGGVILRAARDGSLVPVLSVALILVIMITMAAMFQVFLVRKIHGQNRELQWKPFQRWRSAQQESYADQRGAEAGGLMSHSDTDPLDIELDERPPDFPGTPRHPLLADEFYLGDRKTFCLFNAKNSGISRHGSVFNLSSFPYHLCTHAIYWCATIDSGNRLQASNVDVDLLQNAFAKFPGLKSGNPFLRVFIGVDDDPSLHRIAHDAESVVNFTLKTLHWVVEHRYDGVFLRWSPPLKEGSSQFPALISHMVKTFKRVRSLSVGVVVPVSSSGRDFYADVGHLLNILEPYSILVDPLTAAGSNDGGGTSYFRSFFPYTADSIAKYHDFFGHTVETERGKYHYVCYPLAIAGYSLAIEDSIGASRSRRMPPQGAGDLKAGLTALPYDATCTRSTNSSRNMSIRLKYGVLSARKLQWIAYQDRSSLSQLLEALRHVTGGAPCLGVWDPEWDDFSGHCGPPGNGTDMYPLTRTIFANGHYALSAAFNNT